jgi:hypothetical protein
MTLVAVNRSKYPNVKDQDVDKVAKLQQEFRSTEAMFSTLRGVDILEELRDLGVDTVFNYGCYPYIK